MLVPMKTLVLLLCLGFATALDCTGDEISCTNGELCIPYQFLCDNDSDCADASDEDPEFCSAWRNRDCRKGQALCRANGASECIPIENYCHRTQPACQGTLDRRICSILGDRKLVPIDTIRLPPVNTPGNCPSPYIKVGDQCIAFFSTESTHTQFTWANARTFCEDSGGHLFIIQNGNQYYNLIWYLVNNKFTSDFWLGGRYELGDLSWV
ncbi:low-density lipoprotein receptor-related protein 2-like, partial [Penaeus indicus]|uniref:low-density lipoprotein receptor-related protein 2-like n=1 Tax=Penaeus indicus TaxID=29960 RepID=UPI00300C2D11